MSHVTGQRLKTKFDPPRETIPDDTGSDQHAPARGALHTTALQLCYVHLMATRFADI